MPPRRSGFVKKERPGSCRAIWTLTDPLEEQPNPENQPGNIGMTSFHMEENLSNLQFWGCMLLFQRVPIQGFWIF